MSDPYLALASTIKSHMEAHAKGAISGVATDLGTITDTGLKLDSFKDEIQDFFVGSWSVNMKLPAFTISGILKPEGGVATNAEYEVQPTEIKGVQFNFVSGLKSGDRVLVVPINGGNDAVVICKVVSSGGQ